jgi:hypothetical protein
MGDTAAQRTALARICAAVSLLAATDCGFLPLSKMSFAGTDVLESAAKPAPVDSAFGSCGDAGSQPDYTLNRLKNRVDAGEYLPVPWKLLAGLPWPRRVGLRFRHQWTVNETKDVARFEGVAVQVEGYLAGYKLEIPEAPNCYSTAAHDKDYHLWLSKDAHQSQRQSVVVELTPRVRVSHPGWTEERLAALVDAQARVRVSGWLMLDQMHPENVGRNRVTLWEVHPIMRLEWQSSSGSWISLDSLSPLTGTSGIGRR